MGGTLFDGLDFLGGRGSRRKLGSLSFGRIFLGLEILGTREDFCEREVLVERALLDFVVREDVLREDLDEEELVVLDLRAMERSE
ncbi:MAG: hypothetical protein P8074_25865 [Anaerolineales bacterium]|jgi:hypothetical protein